MDDSRGNCIFRLIGSIELLIFRTTVAFFLSNVRVLPMKNWMLNWFINRLGAYYASMF